MARWIRLPDGEYFNIDRFAKLCVEEEENATWAIVGYTACDELFIVYRFHIEDEAREMLDAIFMGKYNVAISERTIIEDGTIRKERSLINE